MARSRFPKAKPTAGPKLPRQPRDWRRRTHVFINSGSYTHDDIGICGECDMRRDHRVHDLNQEVLVEAAEFEARRLGES